MSTPPQTPVDAAEVDPDAAATAALPGHRATDSGGGTDAPVGPPSQDPASLRAAAGPAAGSSDRPAG